MLITGCHRFGYFKKRNTFALPIVILKWCVLQDIDNVAGKKAS